MNIECQEISIPFTPSNFNTLLARNIAMDKCLQDIINDASTLNSRAIFAYKVSLYPIRDVLRENDDALKPIANNIH